MVLQNGEVSKKSETKMILLLKITKNNVEISRIHNEERKLRKLFTLKTREVEGNILFKWMAELSAGGIV